MELKDLAPVVLLLVSIGLLLGIGIITFDKFGDAAAEIRTETQNVTLIEGVDVDLNYGNITQVSSIVNSTNLAVINTSHVVVNQTIGDIYLLYNGTDMYGGLDVQLTYNWKDFETVTDEAMDSMITNTSDISSTWLGLIVTIIILSIILSLVIRSFTGR